MIVEIFAITDNGQRSGQNEDNFAVCKDIASKSWGFKPNEKLSLSKEGALLLVADGMGGANAGEVASDIAQRVVQEQFNAMTEVPASNKQKLSWLKKAILIAHEAIVAHQVNNLETSGMGTTIVILWATLEKAYVAWCGDSRLYVYREGQSLEPTTDDHSYVWELVKQGQITHEQARLHPESNIITQSLGDSVTPPSPEAKAIDYLEGDRFLLCSDGLNSMLTDEQIRCVLEQEKDTVEACKKLIEEANAAGGRDNITVVLLDVRKLSASKPALTPTQELKKFIKKKNRTIAVLGVLLISILGYMAFAKFSFPDSNQAVTKTASTGPKTVDRTVSVGDLVAPSYNEVSPASLEEKAKADTLTDEERKQELNQQLANQNQKRKSSATHAVYDKKGNPPKNTVIEKSSIIGKSLKGPVKSPNGIDSLLKFRPTEMFLEMNNQELMDSYKIKKPNKVINKGDSTTSN